MSQPKFLPGKKPFCHVVLLRMEGTHRPIVVIKTSMAIVGPHLGQSHWYQVKVDCFSEVIVQRRLFPNGFFVRQKCRAFPLFFFSRLLIQPFRHFALLGSLLFGQQLLFLLKLFLSEPHLQFQRQKFAPQWPHFLLHRVNHFSGNTCRQFRSNPRRRFQLT